MNLLSLAAPEVYCVEVKSLSSNTSKHFEFEYIMVP